MLRFNHWLQREGSKVVGTKLECVGVACMFTFVDKAFNIHKIC